MVNMSSQTLINAELKRAEQARALGKEGQARVCARRAAGIAAHDYYERRGEPIRTSSAYDLLKMLVEDSALSVDLRQSAALFTLRVDNEFKLPPDIDLIIEAKKLCGKLMKLNTSDDLTDP